MAYTKEIREAKVLELTAAGMTNKQIAVELGVAYSTVCKDKERLRSDKLSKGLTLDFLNGKLLELYEIHKSRSTGMVAFKALEKLIDANGLSKQAKDESDMPIINIINGETNGTG